jgi:hypothetical protein
MINRHKSIGFIEALKMPDRQDGGEVMKRPYFRHSHAVNGLFSVWQPMPTVY